MDTLIMGENMQEQKSSRKEKLEGVAIAALFFGIVALIVWVGLNDNSTAGKNNTLAPIFRAGS